jgi:alanine dehydrogenase
LNTLLLTDEEVKGLLSMGEVLEAVEKAFGQKGLGRVQMPVKSYLYYKRFNGDLRTMPSYLEDLDISAVKIVNVHPDNHVKHGLPTVMAVIVLVDPATGLPLSIMGGSTVTSMRTGAAGGVAAKYLARRDSSIAGFVGAGTQARTQLMGLAEVFKTLKEVRAYDRDRDALDRFVLEMTERYSGAFRIRGTRDIQQTVAGADVVVTTTPSREPLVMNEMISQGTHISCIGADAIGKEELDPAILKRARIVVDEWEQASHSGEINVPVSRGLMARENIWADIGEVVAGLKAGRQGQEEITVFVSTGLAVQDAVTAEIAYRRALQKGIGQSIKIV